MLNLRNQVFRPVFNRLHYLLHASINFNPLISKQINGRKITNGHIRTEQETNPLLDTQIITQLTQQQITNNSYTINNEKFVDYLTKVNYPKDYFGNKERKEDTFIEKAMEHFVSIELLQPLRDKVVIDIGAANSPFSAILKTHYEVKKAYAQDLVFKEIIERNIIGGKASKLPFGDGSVDALTLHCALEHFEGTNDVDFFKEAERVLKKGGKCIVLPLYLASEYTIHLDPVSNILKFYHTDITDDKDAVVRYCDSKQHFSRHYNVNTFKKRIVDVTNLDAEILYVKNFKLINENSYLRFIGVFTKQFK